MRHNLQFDQFSTRHIRLWVCWTRSHLSYSVWKGEAGGEVVQPLSPSAVGDWGREGFAHWTPERSLLQGLPSS